MLHQKCLCKRNSDSFSFICSRRATSSLLQSVFIPINCVLILLKNVFGIYMYTLCICGYFGRHPNSNLLGDTGSQFSLGVIHFTYILSKGIHLSQPQVFFCFHLSCLHPKSCGFLICRVKLDFFIWLFNLHYFP